MVDVNQVEDKKSFSLKQYSVQGRKSYHCNGLQFTFDSIEELGIYFKFVAWLKDTSSDFSEDIKLCSIFYNKSRVSSSSSSIVLYNSLVLEYNELAKVEKSTRKRKIDVCIYIYIYIYILLVLTIIILIIGCC